MSATQTIALDWQQQSDGRDEAQVPSLFCLTVNEQQARCQILREQLNGVASGAARKRELIAKELIACRQLYEIIWAEMDCTLYSTPVEKTRRQIEQTRNS